MRNKILSGILCSVLTFMLTLCIVPYNGACYEYTVDEVSDLIGGIVDYKLSQDGAGSIEDWLGGAAVNGAGTISEWYVLTFSQEGYHDLAAYENSLCSYLEHNNVSSATSREKYALALCAAGSTNSYITDILDTSIGGQGIMSWIYGLHVLNNGYTCSQYTTDSVIDKLLSMQLSDNGWAIFGEYGDIDVTAMTIQALAPHYGEGNVADAIDRGLDFLSQRQKDNGGYESFGTANPESTAQVLTALSALGIDCRYDDRFIKNGNNLIDGITAFRLSDGSFSHTLGGSSNDSATVQSLYSLVAFRRMTEGRSPLLVLDNRRYADNTPSLSDNAPQQHNDDVHHEGTTAQTIEPAKQNSSGKSDKPSKAATSAKTSSSSSTSTVSALTTKKSKSATTITSNELTDTSETNALTKAEQTQTAEKIDKPHKNKNYKPVVIIIIISASAVIALIIFIIGKRNYKNFIFLAIAAGAAIAVVLLTDIKSPEEYYNGEQKHKENAVGTVTLEIRCDTIAGKSDSEYIPEDGIILQPTAFDIEAGDTVFDILTEAAQTYGIQVENKGASGSAHGMVYIAGINYIYEYDFGDLSGWVYHVNGITPSRSCGEYELSDGDKIEWLYTCELGHDLDEVYEE